MLSLLLCGSLLKKLYNKLKKGRQKRCSYLKKFDTTFFENIFYAKSVLYNLMLNVCMNLVHSASIDGDPTKSVFKKNMLLVLFKKTARIINESS